MPRAPRPGDRAAWAAAALAALGLLLVLPGRTARAAEPLLTRISDVLVSADEAWREPGFRLQLRFGYERFLSCGTLLRYQRRVYDWEADVYRDAGPGRLSAAGVGGAFAVEPGVRVTPWLTLSATIRYAGLVALDGGDSDQGGGGGGFRWSTTAEASWHPWRGLLLTGGLGYGGLYFSNSDWASEVSLECFPGHGALGLARLGYLMAVGELFATGPVLEASFQATRCLRTEWVDPPAPAPGQEQEWYESQELRLYNWWRQPTFTLAWSFAWR